MSLFKRDLNEQSDAASSEGAVSRRWFGRAIAMGVPAAVVFAAEDQHASAATTSWDLTGNVGTSAPTNFLGTTDAHSLVLKTDNAERLRITPAGLIGVGTTTPGGQLNAVSSTQIPVKGDYTGTVNVAGVRGSSTSSGTGAIGVSGVLSPTGAIGPAGTGVLGTARPGVPSAVGIGVTGHHTSQGVGVYGFTDGAGTGVKGTSIGGASIGVLGSCTSGGTGGTFSSDTGLGLKASTATSTAEVPAGLFTNPVGAGLTASAVIGYSGAGARTATHPSGGFYGAGGEFSGPNGLIGAASTDSAYGYGVIGLANNTSGVGVYASGTGGASAIEAIGNVSVSGTLSKSGGSFRIDHPLEPATKYLSHSFVESPDMMNVYNGNATLDATGRAVVTMPDWFEALNRDFRYQLTALGSAGPNLHVEKLMTDGAFTIAGGKAGQQVSWQVTGIRQDVWANAHRIPVESDKPKAEAGTYLHPELFGKAPRKAQVAH